MILSLLMKPLARNAFGLTVALLACSSAGAAVDLQTLVDRSPFAPPGQGASATAAEEQPGTLEFRGVVTDEAGTSYSIFDTTTNKGRWLRAEDESGPVRVKGYDAANGQLEVEQNGRPVKLTLKRSTIQAGQPVAAMVAAPAPVNAPGAPGAVNRADPSADTRRLEAVAAEVRRRRALRNAARAQQGQPPAATPAPAQAPAPAPKAAPSP